MERIFNLKLMHFLEMKNVLSLFQCGKTSQRTTKDQLISLEIIIIKAQANYEHFVSILFDIEKAFDLDV